MKKIIVALDGLKYSRGSSSYAIYLAKQMSAHLVGIFLDDFTYHSYKVYDLIHDDEPVSEEEVERCEEDDAQRRKESVEEFKSACREEGIEYSVHHDRNIAIRELLHESIYADLMVIDSKETLTHYEENRPTRFISNLLPHIECPVIVAPSSSTPIRKLVLLYDGDPSSVYAIKMFSCLFSTMEDLETEVITVKTNDHHSRTPDNRLMREFMRRHYPNAQYTILKGYPDIEVTNYLKHKHQGEIVILGAYRRGLVSRWFRPSMADTLMQELTCPLFIAHNK